MGPQQPDPAAVYRTAYAAAPAHLRDSGVRGRVWLEVVPHQGAFRVHVRAEEFEVGVGSEALPEPTHPYPGFKTLETARATADAWFAALLNGSL